MAFALLHQNHNDLNHDFEFLSLDHNLRRFLLKTSARGLRDNNCVPHVSAYTDCTEANKCLGCTKCDCTSEGTWNCNKVYDCSAKSYKYGKNAINSALNMLLDDVKARAVLKLPSKPVYESAVNDLPKPQQQLQKDQLLESEDIESEIVRLMSRQKRATKNRSKAGKDRKKLNDTTEMSHNGTIKYFNTIDELNEDTLKDSNASGILPAAKVEMSILLPRADILEKTNVSASNPLRIEYINPHQNIDNNLEGNDSQTSVIDLEEQIRIGIITNHTQQEKDKDLSKIVVNELKKGKEFIGDKNGPIMSNITFTPENDTLTAMAFIAGNLLNKLWSMEKDSGDISMEIENMKHEKVQDLLELFKEPLSMRQEAFLRNALEVLSTAIDKQKDANITLCESIADAKKFLEESKNRAWERSDIKLPEDLVYRKSIKEGSNENGTVKAIEKLNNVLGLMKKFENVHKRLTTLQTLSDQTASIKPGLSNDGDMEDSEKERLADDEGENLSMFGKILEKVTKLLLPYKAGKKMASKIRALNAFSNKEEEIKEKMKNQFKIDLSDAKITSRDKTILDYLTKIKSNPRTLVDDIASGEAPSSYVEGDILRNLAEFFKIKSMIELMKLLDDKTERSLRSGDTSTTNILSMTTEIAITKLQENIENTVDSMKAGTSTHDTTQVPKLGAKDKLKTHLKTILDDLVELQKEKGTDNNQNALNIAEALPCIYNILKSENELKPPRDFVKDSDKPMSSFERLSYIFDSIKKELNETTSGRRMNENESLNMVLPKSSMVWDRVISNIARQLTSARRNSEMNTPLSYKEIQEKIRNVADISDTKKVYLAEKTFNTRPAERMSAFQATLLEAKQHLELLKDIKTSLDTIDALSEKTDVKNYVLTANAVIDENRKAVNNIEVGKTINNIPQTESLFNSFPKSPIKMKEAMKMEPETNENNMKLTRDEILNQLIKNRVTKYIKLKKAQGDAESNPNYGIAKNILSNLEFGNYPLARQLYKIFVNSKQQQNSVNYDSDKKIPGSTLRSGNDKTGNHRTFSNSQSMGILNKQPLVQFEEPILNHQTQSARRSQMMKNLLNSKNFRLL